MKNINGSDQMISAQLIKTSWFWIGKSIDDSIDIISVEFDLSISLEWFCEVSLGSTLKECIGW
jgi:hypothetical protein